MGVRFGAWVGERAALIEPKAVRLYDPRTRKSERVAVCADEPHIDAENARAVAQCEGGRSLEITSLTDGTREKLAVPLRAGETAFDVALARSGKDVLVRVGRVNDGGEVHGQRLLALTPGTNKLREVPLESTAWRGFSYDHRLEDTGRAKPPQGRRSVSGGAEWPLRVRGEDGKEVARWGPDGQHEGKLAVRARDGGLDLTRLPGSLDVPAETMRLRIGAGEYAPFDASVDRGGEVHPLGPLDAGPGGTLPTFPVPGAWTLEAAGRGALLYSPPQFRWFTNELVAFEPMSGSMLARVLVMTNAAVARYPDGTVELFGDEAAAARGVRCFDGTLYRPFAACAAKARVSGRFKLEL
jgi:hypothetical protein